MVITTKESVVLVMLVWLYGKMRNPGINSSEETSQEPG